MRRYLSLAHRGVAEFAGFPYRGFQLREISPTAGLPPRGHRNFSPTAGPPPRGRLKFSPTAGGRGGRTLQSG